MRAHLHAPLPAWDPLPGRAAGDTHLRVGVQAAAVPPGAGVVTSAVRAACGLPCRPDRASLTLPRPAAAGLSRSSHLPGGSSLGKCEGAASVQPTAVGMAEEASRGLRRGVLESVHGEARVGNLLEFWRLGGHAARGTAPGASLRRAGLCELQQQHSTAAMLPSLRCATVNSAITLIGGHQTR